MSQPIQQKHIIYIGLESEFHAQILEKIIKKLQKLRFSPKNSANVSNPPLLHVYSAKKNHDILNVVILINSLFFSVFYFAAVESVI